MIGAHLLKLYVKVAHLWRSLHWSTVCCCCCRVASTSFR